jgi:CPA2 family monovalent cation:H+ antiporter-2
MLDPQSLINALLVIMAVLAVVMIVIPLANMLRVRILGVPLATAVPVGAAFAQIGEFSLSWAR